MNRQPVFALLAAAVALPWLVAFTQGPSPAVLQAVASGVALGAVLLCWACLAGDQNGERDAVQALAIGWLAASTLSSCMALTQYFDMAGGLQPWVSTSHGVAFANLRQRNQFATLVLLGLVAWMWLTPARKTTALDGLWIGWWALLVAGLAATHSRTGLIGLVLVVLARLVWRASASRFTLCCTLALLPVYALASFALPYLAGQPGGGWGALSRLAEGDALCASRLTLWSNVLHLIALKPWLGWGWGNLDYAHFVTLYPGERFCAILDNAHNLPLHLAVELGVPLATLASLGLLAGLWQAKPWRETSPPHQMVWTVLTVIGLHSLLEYPLWYGPFQMVVALCALVLWRLRKAFLAPAAVLLTAVALVVGWDYRRVSQIYLEAPERDMAYQGDTLGKVKESWLFGPQAMFAELSIVPLTQANAAEQHRMATRLLHFSPEPRVVARLVDSAALLGRDDDLAYYLPRFKAAFPEAYAGWRKAAMPQSSPTFLHASPAASRP
ncbi:MAG: hypothetical protein RLZZ401_1953 [Pseudomonadota bacterium]